MRQSEVDLLAKYFYFAEERLIQVEKEMADRTERRTIDSIDLLEHIIAKERLKCFQEFKHDIINILKL